MSLQLSLLLPKSAAFEILKIHSKSDDSNSFTATIRVNLTSADEIKNWVKDLGETSKVAFVLKQAIKEQKKASFYRRYLCNLSDCNKAKSVAEDTRAPNLTSRNHGCQAAIRIWILNDGYTTLKEKTLQQSFPAKVEIDWNHNHSISSAHFYSLLRPLEETKSKFIGYFEDQLSVIDAMKANMAYIKQCKDFELIRANKALNPSKWTVYYWYSEWRELRFGSRLNSFAALEKMKSNCEESGIILRIQQDPFSAVVVTPMMQRAHQLDSSASVCFVDSTSTCDAENHSITFILAACSIGAIPLGILITENQTESAYTAGFDLFKEAVGPKAFAASTYCSYSSWLVYSLHWFPFYNAAVSYVQLSVFIGTLAITVQSRMGRISQVTTLNTQSTPTMTTRESISKNAQNGKSVQHSLLTLTKRYEIQPKEPFIIGGLAQTSQRLLWRLIKF